MRARAIALSVSLSVVCVAVSSWGMPPKKQSKKDRKEAVAQAELPVDDVTQGQPFPDEMLDEKVGEDLSGQLEKLSLEDSIDAASFSEDSLSQGLSIEWAENKKSFSIETASRGIYIDSPETAVLTSDLLPDRSVIFENIDPSSGSEYVLLFPERGLDFSPPDPLWIQLVMDYFPEIDSCEGCINQPVVKTLNVAQDRYVVAFAAEQDIKEIRLKTRSIVPAGHSGIICSSSALLTPREAVYLGDFPIRKQPETPVFFGYRQVYADRVLTGGVVKDFSVRRLRPHVTLPPLEKKSWLGISAAMNARVQVVKPDQSILLDKILPDAERRQKLVRSCRNQVLQNYDKQDWAGKRDTHILPVKECLQAMPGQLDFHHRFLSNILPGERYLQKVLITVTHQLTSVGLKTPVLLPDLKQKMINLTLMNADAHLSALLVSFVHALPALIKDSTVPPYDSWLHENLDLVLKIAFKLMIASMEMYGVWGEVIKRNPEQVFKSAFQKQNKHVDFIRYVMNALFDMGILYPFENIFTDNLPSELEIQTMEELGSWFLNMTIAQLKKEIEMSSSMEHVYEAGDKIGSHVVSILNYSLIIQSADLFKKTIKQLFASCIRISNIGTERAVYIESGQRVFPECSSLAGVMLKGKTRGVSDVSGGIIRWINSIDIYIHKVLQGRVILTDRGMSLINSVSNGFGLGGALFQRVFQRVLGVWHLSEDELTSFQSIVSHRHAADTAVRSIVGEQFWQEFEIEEHGASADKNLGHVSVDLELVQKTQPQEEDNSDYINRTSAFPTDPSPVVLWKSAMQSARELVKRRNYKEAIQTYQSCIDQTGDNEILRAYSLIEKADTVLAPWRSMISDLEPSFAVIKKIHERINKINPDKLQSLFLSRCGLSFDEYEAIVRETPFRDRELISVPNHEERMKFWLALRHVRDCNIIPASVLVQSIEYYRQAILLLGTEADRDESILMYKKVLEWLTRVYSQHDEAVALTKVIQPLNEKLISFLKIIGTYRTGGIAPGVSWKSVLAQEVSTLGNRRYELEESELEIFALLNKAGLAEGYDWMLLPHQRLFPVQSQVPGRKKRILTPAAAGRVLWGDKTPEELKADNIPSLMLITLAQGKALNMRVKREDRIINFAGKNAVTALLNKELSKGHPGMIMACRSGSRDEFCDELALHSCLASPVRIRKGLGRGSSASGLN